MSHLLKRTSGIDVRTLIGVVIKQSADRSTVAPKHAVRQYVAAPQFTYFQASIQ